MSQKGRNEAGMGAQILMARIERTNDVEAAGDRSVLDIGDNAEDLRFGC
ncbi:MAG: hypothetical protein OXG11_00915 [Chloroflexi bacterium]|nr:hypothetical protein [Chloroflexota bacterium]